MNARRSVPLALLALLLLPAALRADDWPMAGRSPTRNAVSPEKDPPLWWQLEQRDNQGKVVRAAKNIRWSANLGDHTKGDPVIAGGLVWVGTNNGRPRDPKPKGPAPVLMCFAEKDGTFLYQYVTTIDRDGPLAELAWTGQSASPVAEGGFLWFTTPIGEVVCLDVGPLQERKGLPRQVWKLDLRKELGVWPSEAPMGYGKTCSISAPYQGRIYVLTGNGVDRDDKAKNPKAPSLVCLDKRTGKVLWSDDSPGKDLKDGQYSSPLVIEIDGAAQVIAPMGDGWVRSFDALTGKLLWKCDVNARLDKPRRGNEWNNIFATPVYDGRHVYVATGNNPVEARTGPGYVLCLDPRKQGDVSFAVPGKDGQPVANPNSAVVWRFGGWEGERTKRFTGSLGNVVVHEGLAFVADQRGYVLCLDAKSGELIWKHDVQADIVSTPLVVAGKLYVATEDGYFYLFAAARDKKLLAQVDVENSVGTSPVFANGTLYLTTRDLLLAVAGKQPGPQAAGHDWPQFGRDGSRNAVSPETGLPLWWRLETRTRPGANILWTAPLGTLTLGDPVVVDGRIWIGTNNDPVHPKEDASVLACYDTVTGQRLYRYVSPRLGVLFEDWPGSSMAGSPLIEGDRLWFVSNRAEVICLDILPVRQGLGDAKVLWKLDLRKQLGVVPYGTPMGLTRRCSPAGFEDWIYVITGNGVALNHKDVAAPQAPSLVCLEKKTGKVVWQDASPGKNILQGQPSSPLVIQVQGKPQVVAALGDGWVRAFEPGSGKLIWEFDTNPKDAVRNPGGRGTSNGLLATPVFHDGRLYIGNGQDPERDEGPAWLYCIDPGKTGDISPELADGPGKGKPNPNSGMVWRFGGLGGKERKWRFQRTVSNVVVDQGLVIAVDHAGHIYCLDARSGEQYWWADLQSPIFGSPLVVDGKVVVADDSGRVTIFALAKAKKALAEIDLYDRIRCSPVFAHGVLYIAAGNRLVAIAGTEKADEGAPAKDRPRAPDAVFVPTPQDVVEKMLQLAAVKKTDLVYDLGCGDGRIVVTAAKKYGCKAAGFDLDATCVKLAREAVERDKLAALVTIEQKDLFTVDLAKADVVTLYLGERLNAKLIPQLEKLKPGARIVSHQFPIEGWQPDQVIRVRSAENGQEHTLYLWTVPAKKAK
jgi:outer membrane protein assembly factor BamB/precorrin-6B methylase 2